MEAVRAFNNEVYLILHVKRKISFLLEPEKILDVEYAGVWCSFVEKSIKTLLSRILILYSTPFW